MTDFVEKREGARKQCHICYNDIFCEKNDYTGKLQWQNEDGQAHYRFIREGVFECNNGDEK